MNDGTTKNNLTFLVNEVISIDLGECTILSVKNGTVWFKEGTVIMSSKVPIFLHRIIDSRMQTNKPALKRLKMLYPDFFI